MTNVRVKSIVVLFLTCIAVDAFAMFVSESDVRKAAEAFVSTDAVGSSVLSGRSVACVSKRDGLWVVALAPDGHVIFSGSDIVDPIVGFSKNNFVEPDPESPAFAVLDGANASVVTAEAQGAGTRHARWTKLLGGMAKKGLLKAADIENPDTVVIPPFLESHYNQWQPYNDYAPVYEASTNDLGAYRGRCPCGCVATATAQGFRHFRWPARIDRVDSFSHSFTDAKNVEIAFPLRFNGHVPVNWGALDDDYVNYTSVCVTNYYQGGYSWGWKNSYDLRGTVPEAVRYPIARLIMFADVLAHMSFKSGGSSANYGTVAGNASDWYTQGTWVSATDARVKSDIENGVPVQVSIPGHAVVGHGWANDGTDTYIYLNYGWGGGNDGYYNINGTTIQNVFVGHYPRAKPQVDPLPTVSGTSLSLNWHFPDFYTNNLSGFTVSISRTATTPSTFLDDFSASEGSSTSDDISIATDSEGYDGNLLFVKPTAGGTYTFPGSYTLTSASVLTFRLYSFAALGATYTVEARFNGGEWTPICTPTLQSNWGASGWSKERVFLGANGGQTVQFRIRNSHSGSYYSQEQSRILLDDFTVTDVLAPIAPEVRSVGKAVRSLALDGLASGASYSFTVSPNISGALVSAETSEPVATIIEGGRRAPLPGEQTYTPTTLSFSTSDTSETWSYTGSATSPTSVEDWWNASVTATLQGILTSDSRLSFSWKANNNYDYVSGEATVTFINQDGNSTILWSVANNSPVTTAQAVVLPLDTLAGQTGKIKISFTFETSNGYGYGKGQILSPQITNILVPSVPAVAWETETLTALGKPEILSVSAVAEGFYGECGTNTTTFSVVCSETVEALDARPSHLSLVRDEDVSVSEMGNGKFKVCVTPSGINETNFRSRMILTLVGTDSNGTKCYKDLSLRFSQVEPKPTEVHVEATTSSGVAFSVDIPYSWLEDNGLVASGSGAAAYESALASTADADSDGLPNWAEFVCGTDPSDADDRLAVSITMEDGKPVVTYTPDDGRIASGFKAVIKGTTDLAAALSTWEVVTDTRTSTCRFFRVEIVPED